MTDSQSDRYYEQLSSHYRPGVDQPDHPLGRSGRRLLLGLIVFLVVVFGIAVFLKPDPSGLGTHQGLGLPQCSMVSLFGVRCPTCGMTTSFAHFVRGQWIAAARANIAGLGLAMVCFAMIPWGIVSLSVGRLWRIKDPHTAVIWLLCLTTVGSLIQWVVRLMVIHLQ